MGSPSGRWRRVKRGPTPEWQADNMSWLPRNIRAWRHRASSASAAGLAPVMIRLPHCVLEELLSSVCPSAVCGGCGGRLADVRCSDRRSGRACASKRRESAGCNRLGRDGRLSAGRPKRLGLDGQRPSSQPSRTLGWPGGCFLRPADSDGFWAGLELPWPPRSQPWSLPPSP